jgi:RNA polymerase sigma-70 factor (ECF subfamily)
MHAVVCRALACGPVSAFGFPGRIGDPRASIPSENVIVTATLPEHYRSLVAPVRAKCRRLLGDPSGAEDAAQEAFARFLSSGPELGGPHDARLVTAWLYRTCVRVAIDILRDRRRSPILPVSEEAFPCATDMAKALEARSVLMRIAGSVPEEEMEAAMLCRVDGLTHSEAGEVMGISERTVRRLLDRFEGRVVDMRKENTL